MDLGVDSGIAGAGLCGREWRHPEATSTLGKAVHSRGRRCGVSAGLSRERSGAPAPGVVPDLSERKDPDVGASDTRMKGLLGMLSRAFGLHIVLVRYHKARLVAANEAMKRLGTGTSMPVRCSRRFRRHQQALRRLGYVVEREFALGRRPIGDGDGYRGFCRLLRQRFPDGCWSCTARATRVIVTAPASQMSEWSRFLSEYDQGA